MGLSQVIQKITCDRPDCDSETERPLEYKESNLDAVYSRLKATPDEWAKIFCIGDTGEKYLCPDCLEDLRDVWWYSKKKDT